MAITDSPNVGFVGGKIYYLVGDSTSGKTFLSMTCTAEAVNSPDFDNYRIIYDNIEDGMLLNVDKLFGEKVGDRIEPPQVDADGKPVFSDSIEALYDNMDDALIAAGMKWIGPKNARRFVYDPTPESRPFIYVIDSLDALHSQSSVTKFHQHKQARRKAAEKETDGDGKQEKVSGSYGDGKAKINSENLRLVRLGATLTNSIIILISQTRDNPQYGGKTHSGGRSLTFYATVEIWSSVAFQGRLTRDVNGKERSIGTKVELRIYKNRISGRCNSVKVDIFHEYGIDDTGSLVDFLVEEGFWKMTGRTIDTGLGVAGSRDKVIRKLEENNLLPKVKEQAGECWQGIIEACSLKRKPRYA